MTALFISKVAAFGPRLMKDVGTPLLDAACIFGNVGHECGGFTAYHEGGQPSHLGGVSWCQWTGARRTQFEAWCRQRGLALTSDAAGYGFLCHELLGSERGALEAMRRYGTMEGKVAAFEAEFERARIRAIPRRVAWARIAYATLQHLHGVGPAPEPADHPAPVAKRSPRKATALAKKAAPRGRRHRHA